MKKLFTFLFTALMSVSLLASPTSVPTTSDLALKYDVATNVVLCCYFDVAPCNTVVLAGSYNGWSDDPSECVAFEALDGFDGWWVAAVKYTEGLQAKPLQLSNGTFDGWTYQVGDPDAWVWQAGETAVIGYTGYPGESNVSYNSAGAYIYEVKYWKNNNNPCTAVYHNYTLTVINEGCDGLVVPFITGGMTNWTITQLNKDAALTLQYGAPTYTYSFKAAVGSSYQLLSGLADATGTIVEMPDWEEKAYLQKYVDGKWVRIPGEEGDNLLTKEETSIVFDLRDTATYRWARCVESLIKTYTIHAKLPTEGAPDSVELVGGWGVDTWNNGVLMTYSDGYWTATVEAFEGGEYKFRSYGTWANELLMFYTDNGKWLAPNLVFDTLKTVYLDLSGEYYRWSAAEKEDPQSDDPYYSILLLDPKCNDNPEFAPVLCVADGFANFEKTSYAGKEMWMTTVQATPGSFCHICELHHTFGNEIQYFDTVTQQWWGMPLPTYPYVISGDSVNILYLDYSDTQLYRYALCGKLGYDDSTLVDMTVKFKAPAGAPEKVALVGDFAVSGGSGWVDGILMKYKDGCYTATVKATLNSQFKFKEYADTDKYNYIYYTNGSPTENYVFGEFVTDSGVVYVDMSDSTRYKWQEWSDYTPVEIYQIVARADSSQNGMVSGSGEYQKGETAVIMATPRKNCKFERWEDGNILNPRTISVTEDAVYTAVFRREVPLQPVITSDTMYFTAADTLLKAIRVYSPQEIGAYDKLIIATVDNKNVMGAQKMNGAEMENYREAVPYVAKMNIAAVSVMEVVPNNAWYRLRVSDGELAPRCEDCYQKLNQLYATQVGADWYFAQYEKSVVPEAAAYANRMILFNEEAPRFSSYRQVTGLDRSQTTLFKLQAPRIIPSEPVEIAVDSTAMIEEEKPMEDIPVAVEPADTMVVISTPYVEFVHTFTLIVWADEARTQVFMMITYDAEGRQISVTRPESVRRRAPQAASISFEIGDLEPTKEYPYTLIACEDDGSILTSLNSSFATRSDMTGIRNILGNPDAAVKFFINGQLFILRDGKLYNALGTQVK